MGMIGVGCLTDFGRLALLASIIVVIPSLVAAAGSEPVVDRQAATTIYQESCSVCHGDDGTGAIWGQESLAMPPRDFTSASARAELTRERMIASVTHGRPGSPMPGFSTQLNPVQVAAIVDYVRARFMFGPSAGTAEQVAGATASVGDNPVASDGYHDRPFPDGLGGRFDRGRAFYLANCVACHGMSGGGDGPRAYFIFPRPRNFLDPATQQILNRPTLFRGIKDGVTGREMPAWGKVMVDQDIADIAEYVYRQFIRVNPAESQPSDQIGE